MKLELLISAVKADSEKLIEKMAVSTDAVLVNQDDEEYECELPVENGNVKVYAVKDRGVGKSRNLALDKSKGDIILFSDDDIVYKGGYDSLILSEFEKYPKADVIFFNVEVCPERRTYWNEGYKKVHIWNAGRYPAYSIAARANVVKEKKIKFSLYFGGGAKYSCGEDSLFIKDCLKAGLKCIASPICIGKEEPREGGTSTWFAGYNEKLFYDRGILFAKLYGSLAPILGFRFVYMKKLDICEGLNRNKAYAMLKEGIKEGRKI